jgi:hypothetical protein
LKKRVLHIDSRDFYGVEHSSLGLEELQRIEGRPRTLPGLRTVEVKSDPELDSNARRLFAIDVSCPRILFCRSSSVTDLIRHDVSKYLSFAPVSKLVVRSREGLTVEVPTTRNAIFQSKSLKLNEKRALMSLFKSSAPTANPAISSAAGAQVIEGRGSVGVNMNAVEYLANVAQLKRPDLIYAIIHGACLYSGAASKLSANELLSRLSTFISSLDQYEQGCPFIVPMYGNSDIPQAFARTAAVNGAVFILSCDEAKLKEELSHHLPEHQPSLVELPEIESNAILYHGIACIKTATDAEAVSLVVLEPESIDESPIYALCLPAHSSGISAVSVCPPGYTLVHFVQVNGETVSFKGRINKFLEKEEVILEAIIVSEIPGEDPFSIEKEFEHARLAVNEVLGNDPDQPLPVPELKDVPLDEA